MFDENYLKPLSGQIDDIQKQKQTIDNEIEQICIDIIRDKYDNINKLKNQPMDRLVYHIGEISVAYHYYIIKTKSEHEVFKNIIENIFNYIMDDNDCNIVVILRQLKLHISQVSKSLEEYSSNKNMLNLVSSWYSYICNKETQIEQKYLRVEFYDQSRDNQELIYRLAEIEHISEETLKDLIQDDNYIQLTEMDYKILEGTTLYLLDEGALGFTLRNFGIIAKNSSYDPQKTGNFEALRPGLLKLVERCRNVDEARYLLRDSYSATRQLTKLGENRPDIKRQCEKHVKWIESTYRTAIKNRIKELKEKLNESLELLDEGLSDLLKKSYFLISYNTGLKKYRSETGSFIHPNEASAIKDRLIYHFSGKEKNNSYNILGKNKAEFEGKKISLYKLDPTSIIYRTIDGERSSKEIIEADIIKEENATMKELCEKYKIKINYIGLDYDFNLIKKEVYNIYSGAKKIIDSDKYKKFKQQKSITLAPKSEVDSSLEYFEDGNPIGISIIEWDLWNFDPQAKSNYNNDDQKEFFDAIFTIQKELKEKLNKDSKLKIDGDGDWDGGSIDLRYNKKLNESSELLDEGLKDGILKAKANINVAVRKASDKIDSIADKIFGQMKSAKDEDERERIIRNSIPKASSIIKKAITTGAVALLNPALALIGLLSSIAINKRTRDVQRKLILNELQTEFKIVEEKIKDAESENDKKKKYELMRIQAKLQKDIERIRYNLKY